MSSFSGTPTLSLSPSQAASATSAIPTEAAKKIAWQTAVYLVVVFAIVAIVAVIIFLVGRADWTIPISWRAKMEPSSPSLHSTSYIPSPSMLIETMLHFFFETVLPPLQSLRTATMSSMGARSHPQPILPMFAASGFRQPVLTPLRPAVYRDNSFRVPSNPYSGSSGLPASHSHSILTSPAH